MAAIGYGIMAVTGAVSAQFFNFTFGLGLSFLRQIITNGPIKFDLFGIHSGKNSKTSIYSCVILGFAALHMTVIIIIPKFSRNVLKKWFANYLYF